MHADVKDFHVFKIAIQNQILHICTFGQCACTNSGMSLSVMSKGSKVIVCSIGHWPVTNCLVPSCDASTPISSSLLSKGQLA